MSQNKSQNSKVCEGFLKLLQKCSDPRWPPVQLPFGAWMWLVLVVLLSALFTGPGTNPRLVETGSLW